MSDLPWPSTRSLARNFSGYDSPQHSKSGCGKIVCLMDSSQLLVIKLENTSIPLPATDYESRLINYNTNKCYWKTWMTLCIFRCWKSVLAVGCLKAGHVCYSNTIRCGKNEASHTLRGGVEIIINILILLLSLLWCSNGHKRTFMEWNYWNYNDLDRKIFYIYEANNDGTRGPKFCCGKFVSFGIS